MTRPTTAGTLLRSRTAPPRRSSAADVLTGALAGAAGVWVMDLVGGFLYSREDRDALARELQARKAGNDVEYSEAEQEAVDRQPRTKATAGKDVAHVGVEKLVRLIGSNQHTRQPNRGGIALHYALGVLPGALFGVLRRKVPAISAGGGTLYGFGLFVINDEVIAPALGLASKPGRYPWQAHARGAVAHVVLGMVTEYVLLLVDRFTAKSR